jgi:hypothetical protein
VPITTKGELRIVGGTDGDSAFTDQIIYNHMTGEWRRAPSSLKPRAGGLLFHVYHPSVIISPQTSTSVSSLTPSLSSQQQEQVSSLIIMGGLPHNNSAEYNVERFDLNTEKWYILKSLRLAHPICHRQATLDSISNTIITIHFETNQLMCSPSLSLLLLDHTHSIAHPKEKITKKDNNDNDNDDNEGDNDDNEGDNDDDVDDDDTYDEIAGDWRPTGIHLPFVGNDKLGIFEMICCDDHLLLIGSSLEDKPTKFDSNLPPHTIAAIDAEANTNLAPVIDEKPKNICWMRPLHQIIQSSVSPPPSNPSNHKLVKSVNDPDADAVRVDSSGWIAIPALPRTLRSSFITI